MVRLFGLIGLTYLSVLAVVFYLSDVATVIVAFALLLLLTVFVFIKKTRSNSYIIAFVATALIACIVNISYTALVYDRIVDTYDGVSGEVVAQLKEEPQKQYSTYVYRFKCQSLNGEKCNFRFLVYHHDELDIEPYDKVKLNTSFMKSESKGNISERYFLTADFGYDYPEFERIVPQHKPPYFYAIKLRQFIREVFRSTLDRDAFSLCSALLIGDKFALSEDVYKQFREAGVSHLIVVSGMHFSILVGVFIAFANRFYRLRYMFYALAFVFVILYMSITGFAPSVIRSAIMVFVCLIGFTIEREKYNLNSLALAAFIVVGFGFTPYIAGDAGVILSFSTTFAILMLAPVLTDKICSRIKFLDKKLPDDHSFKTKIQKNLKRFIYAVVSLLCVNFSAFLISFPLSIILFGATSTVSVVSSFVLAFPVQCLLYLCVIVAVVGALPFLSFILPVFVFFTKTLTSLVLKTVSCFAELPFSYIYVTSDFWYLWVLFAVALFMWLCFSYSRKNLIVYSSALVVTLLVGIFSGMLISKDVCTLNIYDVDGGTAVLYNSKDSSAVLSLDCSSSKAREAIDEMQHDVFDIDFAVSVGNNADCAKSITSLSKVFAIEDVLLYDTKRTITLSSSTKNVIELDGDYVYTLPDGAKITCYYVDEKYITYFEYHGKTVLVLPDGVDVLNVPTCYRRAHTIVMSSCPENYEYLSCDTLVLSTEDQTALYLMKQVYPICNRVLLTSQGKITLIEEV